MKLPMDPPPLPLGARIDYVARIAVRTVDGLQDGGAARLELEGGPLTFRRIGAAFHVTAPGQPDRVLSADDLPAVICAAVLTHASIRAADHQAGIAAALAA